MSQKRLRIEGGDWSQLVQQIRSIGRNKDLQIETAVVTAPLPALEIKMDRDSFPIDTNDNLYVARHLKAHERSATIDGITKTIQFNDSLQVGEKVYVLTDEEQQIYFVVDLA